MPSPISSGNIVDAIRSEVPLQQLKELVEDKLDVVTATLNENQESEHVDDHKGAEVETTLAAEVETRRKCRRCVAKLRMLQEAKDWIGLSAIHAAAGAGRTEVLQYFFSETISSEEEEERSEYVPMVQLFGEHNRCSAIVELKRELNNAVSAVEHHTRNTPLHLACVGGHLFTVQYLLQLIGFICPPPDPRQQTLPISGGVVGPHVVDKKNRNKASPLHLAIQNQHEDVVEALLCFGAVPDLLLVDVYPSPLSVVALRNEKMLELCLRMGLMDFDPSFGAFHQRRVTFTRASLHNINGGGMLAPTKGREPLVIKLLYLRGPYTAVVTELVTRFVLQEEASVHLSCLPPPDTYHRQPRHRDVTIVGTLGTLIQEEENSTRDSDDDKLYVKCLQAVLHPFCDDLLL